MTDSVIFSSESEAEKNEKWMMTNKNRTKDNRIIHFIRIELEIGDRSAGFVSSLIIDVDLIFLFIIILFIE